MDRLPKILIGVILGIITLFELKKGYLAHFLPYLKKHPWKAYRFPAMAFALLFILAFPIDEKILNSIQNIEGKVADFVLYFGRNLGENMNFWAFVIFIYVATRLFLKKKWGDKAFGIVLSSMLTGVFIHCFKIFFARERPTQNQGAYSFFDYSAGIGSSHQSLPSGDVGLVAAMSTYIFFLLPKNPMRYLVFLMPISTAFARVQLNRHWPSDTILSMGLAMGISYLIWRFKKKNDSLSGNTQ